MHPTHARSSGSKLPRLLLKILLTFFAAVIAAAVGLWFFMNSESGARWARKVIHSRFPEVASVTPAELDRWLKDGGRSRPAPFLLDVRTAEEQEVSTLPGAVCVSPEATAEEVLKGRDRRQPVVVYCAAGYRAATMARRLKAAGCTSVQNLEGGIFAWANAGHPVEKDGMPTTKVHPYSSVFARMLKRHAR